MYTRSTERSHYSLTVDDDKDDDPAYNARFYREVRQRPGERDLETLLAPIHEGSALVAEHNTTHETLTTLMNSSR